MPRLQKIADLPVLDDDAREDAEFRARDRAWSALIRVFDQHQRSEQLSYEKLGRRIGRSRSQVQRWLSSAFNMNLRSIGLLAEGLNADLVIEVRPRAPATPGANYCHPAEAAHARLITRATNAQADYKPAGSSARDVLTAGNINSETTSNLVTINA